VERQEYPFPPQRFFPNGFSDPPGRKVILILSPTPSVNRRCFHLVNVSKEGEVYLCEICGNVVVVKVVGGGELVCCGQPMTLQKKG
jgi:desulfoferrodoxin-like iron-binding protein